MHQASSCIQTVIRLDRQDFPAHPSHRIIKWTGETLRRFSVLDWMKTWLSRLIGARGAGRARLDMTTLPETRKRDIGLIDGRDPHLGG